jgi:hypothetical protein
MRPGAEGRAVRGRARGHQQAPARVAQPDGVRPRYAAATCRNALRGLPCASTNVCVCARAHKCVCALLPDRFIAFDIHDGDNRFKFVPHSIGMARGGRRCAGTGAPRARRAQATVSHAADGHSLNGQNPLNGHIPSSPTLPSFPGRQKQNNGMM